MNADLLPAADMGLNYLGKGQPRKSDVYIKYSNVKSTV